MFAFFAKLLLTIVFFAHCLACIFWAVGTLPDTRISWVFIRGLEDDPVSQQYISSLYWAFTTMVTVGYGDITAINSHERMYSMLAMIIAGGIYAYTLNTIGKKVSEFNMLASVFRENMLYVSQWMSSNNLPKDLKL